MAKNPKSPPVEDTTPVTIGADQYRSMVLAKLRADIATKQAMFTATVTAKAADLDGMANWKMSGGDRFMTAVNPE